jgi:hypothetical protein
MAFDPAPPRDDETWVAPGRSDANAREAFFAPTKLHALGPVLLVALPTPASRAWHRECVIDSYGVRESLWLGDCRLFRLPDSDFFGWERITYESPLHPRSLPSRGASRRCDARVVRASPAGWSAVHQLSALGWEQARQIVQLEGATWCEVRRGG